MQTSENCWFAADMAKAIDAKACDQAMPDIRRIGSVSGWLKAAALAEIASLPVSSHIFIERPGEPPQDWDEAAVAKYGRSRRYSSSGERVSRMLGRCFVCDHQRLRRGRASTSVAPSGASVP